MKLISRFLASAIVGAGLALSAHIYLLSKITPVIGKLMEGKEVLHMPYPFFVNFFAYITALLPGLGSVILYYFISPSLKTQSRFLRGCFLTVLMLLIEGELIRQPLMNYIVGNPFPVVLLQQSEVWIAKLLLAFSIAYIMPLNLRKNENKI